MEHRRRAADFSHLVETSCTTDCGSALESAAHEANSSTEINNVTSRHNKSYNRHDSSDSGSFKSTILAGHIAGSDSHRTSGSSYKTARTASVAEGTSRDASLDSCRRLEIPSVMNRAITTEFSPHPELDLSQTSVEPRSSGEMNRNIVSCSQKSSDDSRDTNYNIKGDAESQFTTEDQVFQSSKHKFRLDSPRACSMKPKDTRNLLPTLDNMLDPSSTERPKIGRKMLRRLSQEFLYSPRTFTERLVTIIDDSETDYPGANVSGVNLSRMTKEFRKMCKFIQDESMPEMAPSLCMNSVLGTLLHPNDDDICADSKRPSTIVESPPDSPSVECSTPHSEHAKKIYRKTPLNIFKKTCRGNKRVLSPGSPNSTRDFEYWEQLCEKSSNSPKLPTKYRSKPLRRSLSTSDISEKAKEALIKCEEQLHSLENLTTVEFETFDSHRGHEALEEKKEVKSSKICSNDYAITRKENMASHLYAQTEETDCDELSNSLLLEKELQRRRCFELATLMQEIEEEAKETNEEYPKALERHGIDPDTAYVKAFSTCLDYVNCLSGMRQSSNLKRKEVSSGDSGIDTRSLGRTLYASTKKSFNNASARNNPKQTRSYATTDKNQRYGAASSARPKSAALRSVSTKKHDKKAASSDNLYQEIRRKADKKSPSVSPRRQGTYLRPAAKSPTFRKSPIRAKRSPTLPISYKTRSLKTPERSRPQEIRVNPRVPEFLDVQSTSVPQEINSPRRKYLGDELHELQGVSSITARSKSPGSKRLTSSSKPSPKVRNPSRERVKKISEAPESPRPSSTKETRSPRNRFFVTPGRTAPVGAKKKTKTYFPSMDEHIYPDNAQRFITSPYPPGLYDMGYKSVVSPVGMYIRGTDINLIHNIHGKKNEWMLTPRKDNGSAEKLKYKMASPRNTPPTNCCRCLSDNENSKSDDNDENINEHEFALPKAIYNQPAQVQMVKESPNRIGGARTRGLLQSTQDRVLIRHEGKRFEKDEDNVPESCESDDPTYPDTSIHVLKSAEKTNFMGCRRKL